MTIYGYARCSTDKQDTERQVRDLMALGVKRENIYIEVASGTKKDRPEYIKLLKVLQSGDELKATEVSRCSRSTSQLLELYDLAKERKLKLSLGTINVDYTEGATLDPMALAMAQIMGVMSELERNMISERTKSGMATAKANGKQIGRSEGEILKLEPKVKEYIKIHLKDPRVMTKSNIHTLTGLSRVTINKYIKLCTDNPDYLY